MPGMSTKVIAAGVTFFDGTWRAITASLGSGI
jgi:hypothetical protein